MRRDVNNRLLTRGAIILFASLILCAHPNEGGAETNRVIEPNVEKAILSEDWSRVAELLSAVNPQTDSPVLRLIKGHAALALNHNNESLCLFLSVSSQDGLREWETWTQDFATKHPQKAIVHYFKGDALARMERWDASLTAFHAAVNRHAGHPLVLHARGVAYASIGELDKASEDFIESTKTKVGSSLAELFASRGSYILQKKTDAKKALEWFERALKLSPDYILALNGRASARILLQEWEGAASDLKAAKIPALNCTLGITKVIDLNATVLMEERNKTTSSLEARVAGINPGMSLQESLKRLDKMTGPQRQMTYDLLNNAASFNRSVRGGFFNPSTTEGGVGVGIKQHLVGPAPSVEAKFSAKWDWTNKAQYNETRQTTLMDAMRDRYGITGANPISNFTAWTMQHFRSPDNVSYGKLTGPQGVSSREIGEKSIDTGDWNVFTIYGLVYKINAEVIAPITEGKSS